MKAIVLSLLIIFSGMGYAFAEPVTAQNTSESKTHYVDEQIMIMADISNNQDTQQDFAYLTQVSTEDGIVVSLSWLTGSLSPRQSFSPAQSWIPNESGTFHINVYVWESIDNPTALSPPLSMTITVVDQKS